MVNTGGRIKCEFGKLTRYVNTEGLVSDLVYTIDCQHTDFKARVALRNNDSILNVHHSRLIDVTALGKAVALCGEKEVNCVCPKCNTIHVLNRKVGFLPCCNVEVCYMSEAAVSAASDSVMDLEALKSKYEVWTKKSKFNESIDLTVVQCVLLAGDKPRKMIFNLYNGKFNTGKSAKQPRFEEFDAGIPAEGQKKFWHDVDPAKYAEKLTKDGYAKL